MTRIKHVSIKTGCDEVLAGLLREVVASSGGHPKCLVRLDIPAADDRGEPTGPS